MKTMNHSLRLLQCVCVCALLTAPLTATSVLVYDSPPMVTASGKCYDILDTHVPLSRTYSSVFGTREKTEIFFHHQGIVEDIAAENLLLWLKADIIRGMRFGAYATYLGYGGFGVRNERAEVIQNFSPSDILIGVPVMFSARGLNLMNDPTNRSGFIDFLNLFTGGINLNYYQSSIDDATARTFFVDANVTFRFKIPYLGMPEALITEADVEKERLAETASYEEVIRGQTRSLKESKTLKPDVVSAKEAEYQKVRTAGIADIEDRYAKRKVDVKNVYATRAKLFEFSRDMRREIDPPYVSSFLSNVNAEISALIGIAGTTVRENGEALTKITAADIDNNAADIDFYRKKLEKYAKTPELLGKVDQLIAQYENFLANKDAGIPPVDASGVKVESYEVGAKEGWDSIAQKFYGSTDLAKYLISFNGVKNPSLIKKGDVVKVPEVSHLMAVKERDAKVRDMEEKMRGYREYRVAETNETYQSIARKMYGSDEKAKIILSYNNLRPDARPEVGQTLKIPLENVAEQKRERIRMFNEGVSRALADFGKYQMPPVERLLFDKVVKTLAKRVALFEYRDQIAIDTAEKQIELKNLFAQQVNALSAREAELLRELKKISLKKELDLMSASDAGSVGDRLREYKSKERVLFSELLIGIYRAKREVIETLSAETEAKGKRQIVDIEALYAKKNELALEDVLIAKSVIGDDKQKISRLDEAYAAEQEKNALDKADEIALAKRKNTYKMKDYDWQKLVTEMIYLSTDEQKETLALGLYGRNIGLPYSYGGASDTLPISFGADVNYNLLNTENHLIMLYLHYGYSAFENSSIGLGSMYRLFDFVEVRAGGYLDDLGGVNSMISIGAGMAVMFDIGLMNCRIDAAAKYEAVFGLGYTLSLNVLF